MNEAITLLLAAAAGTATASPPDVEIGARVKAREIRIEQQGRASAQVRVQPERAKLIEVERNLPKGRSTYRNLDLTLKVEGRLADQIASPDNTLQQGTR
jgi:hypothetical protein